MEDLIDRKELLKIIEEDFSDDCGQWYIDQVENAPKVEAEPVRYGHWEWEMEDKYRCSECGSVTRVDEVMGQPVYERCPYCGAKMRREDE